MRNFEEKENLIETKNLVKTYPMGEGVLHALDDINITFKSGEFAGFVGPSGSGKTTLLTERREMVTDALHWVGLADRANSNPSQLSGGQSQRVAIARAMVKRPALLLADEPTANLDAENSHNILRTMERLNRELGTTFIFATHDQKVIRYLRRIITLVDGKVASDEARNG